MLGRLFGRGRSLAEPAASDEDAADLLSFVGLVAEGLVRRVEVAAGEVVPVLAPEGLAVEGVLPLAVDGEELPALPSEALAEAGVPPRGAVAPGGVVPGRGLDRDLGGVVPGLVQGRVDVASVSALLELSITSSSSSPNLSMKVTMHQGAASSSAHGLEQVVLQVRRHEGGESLWVRVFTFKS